MVHVRPDGPVEVARHLRTTPGTPRLDDSHFEPRVGDPLNRSPKAVTGAEAEFLALGAGAATWLVEAGEAGATRVRAKMAKRVALAKIIGGERVDWALGHAAVMGRFADGDLESILDHRAIARSRSARAAPPRTTASRAAPNAGTGSGDDHPLAAAPPLPDDIEAVLRRLRLPHMRRVAPEVLATARAQRWEPAEILRALLVAELDGRDLSAAATRRAAAGFPTGKTFASWDESACSIPAPTQARCAPWNGSGGPRTWWCADRRAPGKVSSSKPWDTPRWKRR